MAYVYFLHFFFFKQKTAYDMRISDWSSDVCSSDLRLFPEEAEARQFKEELSILDAAMAKGALTTENHRRAVEALRHEFTGLAEAMREIGRASCRERVCQYV